MIAHTDARLCACTSMHVHGRAGLARARVGARPYACTSMHLHGRARAAMCLYIDADTSTSSAKKLSTTPFTTPEKSEIVRSMPRVVVTAADGSPLLDRDVRDAVVVEFVVQLIETLPSLPIYIEGEELLDEQRDALIHQARALRQATSRVAEDMTPDEFQRTSGTLRECYEDLRRLHFSSARELGLLVQAHNAAVVEEGIKARFYLHQSLQDIDAIDTSVAVARCKRAFETQAMEVGKMAFAPITVSADMPPSWNERIFGERGKKNRRKQ